MVLTRGPAATLISSSPRPVAGPDPNPCAMCFRYGICSLLARRFIYYYYYYYSVQVLIIVIPPCVRASTTLVVRRHFV